MMRSFSSQVPSPPFPPSRDKLEFGLDQFEAGFETKPSAILYLRISRQTG